MLVEALGHSHGGHMDQRICDAIEHRTRLRFIYEGYERIVEPHVYGINTANHEALSAWLVGGWSTSEPEPGWRNYLVREMHDLQVLATTFEGPRSGYNPDAPAFRQIYCRLGTPSAEPHARPLPAESEG